MTHQCQHCRWYRPAADLGVCWWAIQAPDVMPYWLVQCINEQFVAPTDGADCDAFESRA